MKKMMKKISRWVFAVLMVTALCLSAAACGSKEESKDPSTTIAETEETRNLKEENEPEVTTTASEVEETTTEELKTESAEKTSCGNVIGTAWCSYDFLHENQLKGYNTMCYKIKKITFLDSLDNMPEEAVDISEAEDGSVMYWLVEGENGEELFIAGEGGVDANEDCSEMFYNFKSLEEINFNGCFYTQNAKNMSSMFALWNTDSDVSVSLDLSGFDTSNVTDMSGMFSHLYVEELDLSGFDTSNVTDMSLMFYYSDITSLDLTSFDTSNVTDMSGMFNGCVSLTEVDLSGFDTSNLMDMGNMFKECASLTKLDLSGFDTSNEVDMSYMFYGCVSLIELNLSGFDTSNVTDMSCMFRECSSLKGLNLSSFDTSNVTNMSYMIADCTALEKANVSSFNTSNVTTIDGLFYNCPSLTELDLSNFDTSNIGYQYMGFMGGTTELGISDTGIALK